MNGWIWFDNSKKAVNVDYQSIFEIDKNGILWFRDIHGYLVNIDDETDIQNFLINVAKIIE